MTTAKRFAHVVKLVRADGSKLVSYAPHTLAEAEAFAADARAASGLKYVIEFEEVEDADMDALFGIKPAST